MSTTIIDIARELGVSHATVSRALSGRCPNLISEATRERVLRAADEMGYQPNRMARALATGESKIIAVSLPQLSAPFYSGIMQELQQCLSESGFDMIPVRNESAVDLRGLAVDGAIRIGAVEGRADVLNAFIDMRVPLVLISSMWVENGDYVGVDLYPASRRAVEHLIETGRKRIAFVVLDYRSNDALSRYRAYVEVMKDAGMEPEFIELPDLSRATTLSMMRDYLAAKGCPDGLFCMNDDYAIGVCRAVHDSGLRIPDDAAVIGCDGIEDTEYMNPTISTIVQPIPKMCEVAWNMLRRRMENRDVPVQREVLQATLEIRGSSDIGDYR